MPNLQTKEIFHEIKNQISVCELYTEVIKRTLEKEGVENDVLTRAIKNIKNSLSLIADCATNLKETKIAEYNLSEIVENVFEICRTYNENAQYISTISPVETILIDKNKFTSALVNIVKNAIEANATEIKIDGGNKKLTISNNGEEIPLELQEKIFADGFTTKENGTGLGLMLTQKMLEEQKFKLALKKSDKDLTIFNILAK